MFRDRTDAGRRLAAQLTRYRGPETVVIALPRGGVPVAYEVAIALPAPLDVLVARKLGAPSQPELGIGAIAPGIRLVDERLVSYLNVSEEYIEAITRHETEEMRRRTELYRRGLPDLDLKRKTVVLIDDGLATGITARAAVRAIRRREPARLVLAVPVCAEQTARSFSSEVDDLVALQIPKNFQAVGLWYGDFTQTTDEEVIELLGLARQRFQAGDSASTTESTGHIESE